jgi:hypothetical protein
MAKRLRGTPGNIGVTRPFYAYENTSRSWIPQA